jgi:hypothetical protein
VKIEHEENWPQKSRAYSSNMVKQVEVEVIVAHNLKEI